MVIQNKFDIYHLGKQIDFQGDNIMSIMKKHDIKMVAYSPLSSFPFVMKPSEDPIIAFIANNKSTQELIFTSAQVYRVIPSTKSTILLIYILF